MARYYSDQYNSTVSQTAVEDPRPFVARGLSHSSLKYKRASVTAPAGITTGDILQFFTLKSSDRLLNLYVTTPSFTGTGQPADFGLYAEEGGVLDVDLFAGEDAPLDDLTVAIARVDCLTLAALENEDRGKQLWEMLEEGATQSYTDDPAVNYDVAMTMGTESTVTAGAEIVVEAIYTSD